FDRFGRPPGAPAIEVFPGLNTLRPETAFERFEGQVLMDDEPLAGAAVSLRQHLGNMKLDKRTDADGRFYVFLKKDLTWDLDIRRDLPGPPVRASFKNFEVPPRDPAERWPTKTFEIPDTRVSGDVFYPDGSSVEEPTAVDINSVGADPSFFLSDLIPAAGFEMRGLAPGRYRIGARFDESATAKRGESAPVEFTLEDGREVGPLRLEIELARRLEGQVLAESGEPLAAARVLVELRAPVGQWRSLSLPVKASDASGVFEMSLPASADEILLTVLAPGRVYHQEWFFLRDDVTPVVVTLATGGGTLTLMNGGADAGEPVDHRGVFLLPESQGAPMKGAMLGVWRRAHPAVYGGHPWVLPTMPPGPYRACRRDAESAAYLGSLQPLPASWIADRCGAVAYLPPGGAATLEVPGVDP
ncbi:MAG: hypothetical protein AAFX50_08985, partial [Acidobacteriota bacterium]